VAIDQASQVLSLPMAGKHLRSETMALTHGRIFGAIQERPVGHCSLNPG
jgi:hypothetical protein